MIRGCLADVQLQEIIGPRINESKTARVSTEKRARQRKRRSVDNGGEGELEKGRRWSDGEGEGVMIVERKGTEKETLHEASHISRRLVWSLADSQSKEAGAAGKMRVLTDPHLIGRGP